MQVTSTRSTLLTLGTGLVMICTFIAGWEGKRNSAYLDAVGVPTICYGYTSDVAIGDTATDSECDALLKDEVAKAMSIYDKYVQTKSPANVRLAMTSFIYNVGEGNFRGSTIRRLLNEGKFTQACNQLPRWKYANGKELRGLVLRRESERKLCLK